MNDAPDKNFVMKDKGVQLRSTQDVADFVWDLLNELHEFEQEQEHFWVITLAADNWVKAAQRLYSGTLDIVATHPREGIAFFAAFIYFAQINRFQVIGNDPESFVIVDRLTGEAALYVVNSSERPIRYIRLNK